MQIGPDAALQFERERCTHIIDRWDFYKPIGWDSMAPIVDGPGSIDVYFSCMDSCQRQLTQVRDAAPAQPSLFHPMDPAIFSQRVGYGNAIEDHDYLLYHLGSGPKFVKHCFERTCANHFGDPQEGKKKGPAVKIISKTMQDELFERKCTPSLVLASRIGPMHTVSTYTAITSLLIERKDVAVGTSWQVFSYGSGAASTIFRLKVDHLPSITWEKHEQLDARLQHGAVAFDRLGSRYANTYAKFGWKATLHEKGDYQFPGAYYLTECDQWGRRAYHMVCDPNMKLQGPRIIGIPDEEPVEGDPELYKMFGKEGLPPLDGGDFPDPEEEAKAEAEAAAAAQATSARAGVVLPNIAGIEQQQALLNLLSTLQLAQQTAT